MKTTAVVGSVLVEQSALNTVSSQACWFSAAFASRHQWKSPACESEPGVQPEGLCFLLVFLKEPAKLDLELKTEFSKYA